MPVIIPSGYVQATMHFRDANTASGLTDMVLGFLVGVSPDLVDVASEIAEAWGDECASITSTDVGLNSVEVITETDSAEVSSVAEGTRNIIEPPPNVTAVVQKLTTRRGRRAQGRCFPIGLLAEEDVTERGSINETIRGNITLAYNDFLANLALEDIVMVILQNSEGVSAPLSPPPVVEGMNCDSLCSTQRRRLR